MNTARHAIPIALSILLLTASAQAASFPADFEPRRMTPDEGWLLTSATETSALGGSYRGIGDIDGDGYADYMVGSGNWAEAPAHYLVYGAASGETLSLAPDVAGLAGVVQLGTSLHARGVGDFNGDGLDDWILQPVGDLYRFDPPVSPDGDAYLVLGQAERFISPFDVAQATVIRLSNTAPSASQGESRVHPVGDFNGDGLADLMILESVDYDAESASAWLLYGRSVSAPASLDPAAVPAAQQTAIRFPWLVYADDGSSSIGWEVSGEMSIDSSGDVNGDGRDDLMVFKTWNGGPDGVYVVFGSEAGLPALIDNATLDGANGFSAFGIFPFEDDSAGKRLESISIVQDTTGDQIDDLLVSTSSRDDDVGQIDLLPGRPGWPSTLDLDDLSALSALTVSGTKFTPVGDAGDVNGDGLGDWYFGLEWPDAGLGVVYGRAERMDDFPTDALDGVRGFSIRGTLPGDGFEPSRRPWIDMRAGDVNGDGADDLLLGSSNAVGPVDDIDALLDLDERPGPATGLVAVVLGRIGHAGPPSAYDLHPAYARQLIELRWQAAAQPSLTGFEIRRDGQLIASLDADARRYEDDTAARDTAYVYEITSVDLVGQRSSPVVLRALNDHEHYPMLAGEVYSDTLAELFWVDDGNNPFFGNRDYDVYRDGVMVGSRNGLSWLDQAYDGVEHSYVIDTNPQRYRDEDRLRSDALRLPPQAGTRAPASVGNVQFALANPFELVLSWEPAAWGVEPLTYEILGGFSGDRVLGLTSDNRFVYRLDDTDRLGHDFHVVTVDADGRRSSPLPLYADISDEMQALLPRQPTDIVAIDTTRTSIALRWELDPVGTAPSSYEIRRDGGVIALTEETTYTDTGLQADTRYRYLVVSLADDGLRSRSASLWGALTAGGPFAPASVDALAYGPTTVEVVWPRADTAETYATRYDVRRNDELIATVDALSLMDEDISPGATYRYSVRSVAMDGTRSDTEVTVTVTTPTR